MCNYFNKDAEMLTPEQVTQGLQDRVIAVVAEKTGLHPNTVRKMKSGEFKEPPFSTISKLSDYLESEGYGKK